MEASRPPNARKEDCCCNVTYDVYSRCTHPLHIGCFQLSSPPAKTGMINMALFYCFASQLSGSAAAEWFDMLRHWGKQTQNGEGGGFFFTPLISRSYLKIFVHFSLSDLSFISVRLLKHLFANKKNWRISSQNLALTYSSGQFLGERTSSVICTTWFEDLQKRKNWV